MVKTLPVEEETHTKIMQTKLDNKLRTVDLAVMSLYTEIDKLKVELSQK